MVSGENEEDRIAILAMGDKGRRCNGRRGVSWLRLKNKPDPLARPIQRLACTLFHGFGGDTDRRYGSVKDFESSNRCLEQTGVAGERQKLLRQAAAAERPEPRPRPAAQDDWPKMSER